MAGQNDSKLRQFARVLLERPDADACQRCLDTLETYCVAQIAGAEAATQFPEVTFHLDTCVACAEVYAVLYETLLAPAALPEPAVYPSADIGFLPKLTEQQRAAPKLHDLSAAVAQAIQQSGRSLRLRFSQALLDLLPPPAPAQAVAFRSAGETTALFELQVSEPSELLGDILIRALPLADTQYCELLVQVTIRGQSWPDLEGVDVQLRQGDQQRQATTDAWGEVRFGNVERSSLDTIELMIEIR